MDPINTASVSLSKEVLTVDTESVATERVLLQKFVITEEHTITVKVRREEVRIVREPINDQDARSLVVDRSPVDPVVVILHEERPVVSLEVVPVERAVLSRHQVTQTQAVIAPMRHERVALTSP